MKLIVSLKGKHENWKTMGGDKYIYDKNNGLWYELQGDYGH